jgi:hypothetical protein
MFPRRSKIIRRIRRPEENAANDEISSAFRSFLKPDPRPLGTDSKIKNWNAVLRTYFNEANFGRKL